MGMQRRKIWGVMAHPDFNPRCFVDNEPIPFVKSMEGIGTITEPQELEPAIGACA
jgi:hypothetical protein